MNCHDAGRMLDAYLDEELTPAESSLVAGHLEGCVVCRERLGALEALGRLVRRVPYYSAPPRLRTAVVTVPRRATKRMTTLAWAASITLAVALGASAFRARQTEQTTAVLAEAVINQHVRALTSGHLFDVESSNQHTVKPWFQGKLDFSPPVSDLASSGFPLIGGRVDSIAGRSVAALVYQRRNHVIHVFAWPAVDQTTAEDARSIRGFQERHWRHADLSLWAVSDLNAQELHEFVQAFESSTR